MKNISKVVRSGKFNVQCNMVAFNSIGEFQSYLSKAELNEVFAGKPPPAKEVSKYRTESSGVETYEEAEGLLMNGWDVIAEKLNAKLKVEKKTETFLQNKSVYDVAGYQPSVSRYLNGIPTNMVNQKKLPVKTKVITLYKSIAYDFTVSAQRIERESVEAFRFIQRLEAQGYRVNLHIVFLAKKAINAHRKPTMLGFTVKIKSANERLNISKAAFPLVHPAMLRRLGIYFVETYEYTTKPFGIGHGEPCGGADLAAVLANEAKGEYLLPAFMCGSGIQSLSDLQTKR